MLAQHGFDHPVLRVVFDQLRHVAKLQAGRAHDRATADRFLPYQHAQDRGLSGPVRANEPQLLARRHFEGDVLKDGHVAVVFDDVLNT